MDRWIDRAQPVEGAAPLQLLALSAVAGLALGLLINASWRVAADGESGDAAVLCLAVLIAVCAIVAVVALRPGAQRATPWQHRDPSEAPSQLLAQMHHELRTPLNAMIGFSEVMLRELHGPLGHARYQEYAAHISESGGRLLKASEDALAVAATMSALVADRRTLRRERLPVAALLREAWTASGASGSRGRCPLLSVADGADAEIECDWQATSQALQHLLGEAQAHAIRGGVIAARSIACAGTHRIEIAVEPLRPAEHWPSHQPHGLGLDPPPAGAGLRLALARSLIEMQGATLSLRAEPQGRRWSACVVFPVAPGQRRAGGARRPSATAPCWRPAASSYRLDSAAGPAVAAHASAQSPAAPRA